MRIAPNAGCSLAVAVLVWLAGCATTEDRERQVAAEKPVCNPGEILSCHTSSTGRISDGRFGRNSRRSQLCSCEPESDLGDLVGPSLPREPR